MLQQGLAETEKSIFQGFIFIADSVSISANASNPECVAMHATLKDNPGRPNKCSMMHYANSPEFGPDRLSNRSIPSKTSGEINA
jgi:hypothetical protein